MVGDVHVLQTVTNSNCSKKAKEKKKKKKRGGSKRKMTAEQTLAFKSVSEWVFLDQPSSLPSSSASFVVDDFGVQKSLGKGGEKLVFELHSHSKFSDGFLSPTKLVERAHGNGVSFNSFKWFMLFYILNEYITNGFCLFPLFIVSE
jgi:hypothetical protein